MRTHTLTSRSIEWLRFACAFLVVYLHAYGVPRIPGEPIVWSNGVYDSIQILVSQGICTVAVPIFFLISGYLFFFSLEQWKWATYRDKLKRRLRSLVLPFLLWGGIAVVIFLGVAIYQGEDPVKWLSDRGWCLTLWNNARFRFSGSKNLLGWTMYNTAMPLDYPLWFIRELIVLNLFAPLIHLWVRKTRAVGLGILFLLYITDIWIPLEGFSAQGTFYYSLGACLSVNRKDLTVLARKWTVPAAILSVPLLAGALFTYNLYPFANDVLTRFFTLTGTVTVLAGTASGLEKRWLRDHPLLSASSFFVYAAHTLYFNAAARWLTGRVVPTTSEAGLTVSYLLIPLLTVVLVVAVYALLKRWVPKTTALLTGGR